MTPRNLFNIILKTLGIFFIKDILQTVPQLISAIIYLIKPEGEGEALWTLIFTLLILAVYVCVAYYLIFKTNAIIDKLKLDHGFNQDSLTLNISTYHIFTIAVIVTGAYLLTTEIPNLCKYLFSYFQEKRTTHGMTKPELSYSIYSAAKIIIGLLLIGERKRIAEFIEQQETKKEMEDLE
jgi:hypothetical protein